MLVFKDLEWKSWFDGVASSPKFDNGFGLSIVAGPGKYSTPNDESNSPDDFVSFEVGVIAPNGDWVTKQFIPGLNDDVLGWQDRGQINALMLLVQSKNKK
jgi:hypothetical protein